MRTLRRLALGLSFLVLGPCLWARPPLPLDSAERRIALERLGTLGSALYVGAHPDDENTALLAYLANERKVRVAYLALTRGDGGQNLIGTEQGPALGIIRTEELLAARRIDGAEQLFTRAIDFGYSRSAEESLRIWGHEEILADVVWAIRSFRPDVVITRFPSAGNGGHGHHTASAILAEEAFQAAGDASRFPEQLRFVKPWQPTRLLWNAWRGRNRPQGGDEARGVSVDVGLYNPVLARSYSEIAAESRSMHKSQGFGAAARRGQVPEDFVHVAGIPASKDPFDGIDLSWKRVPGGERVAVLLARAGRAATETQPEAAVPALVEALGALNEIADQALVSHKRDEILAAIRSCLGLWLEATTPTERVAPGETVTVTVMAVNRSRHPLKLERVELSAGASWQAGQALGENAVVSKELALAVPVDAPVSHPYWLEETPERGLYAVADRRLVGNPRTAPWLQARFVLRSGASELAFTLPVDQRLTDPVEGNVYRSVLVVPRVTVSVAEPLLIFPDTRARGVRVRLTSHQAGARGLLHLVAPTGWRVEPERAPFAMEGAGGEATLDFSLVPPEAEGQATIDLLLEDGVTQPAREIQVIDHPHILRNTLQPRAQLHVVRVDLVRPVQNVGYIMGAGDGIPAVLRQLGMRVTLLTDDDLTSMDLSSFEVIVAGVRAYNTRAVLRTAQERLLRYVAEGGTLLVQYNTERGLVTEQIGPRPLHVSSDRVTEEDAAVRILDPTHPLLVQPTRIGVHDFEDWIQERGLYFADRWDDAYVPLLGMHDSGQSESRGALLSARHGRGVFIYTGLAFFRQLPAGTPGALRLFVNLLAAGKGSR
jgi:LmbE family N-acetylglucosaminyl deacetylase